MEAHKLASKSEAEQQILAAPESEYMNHEQLEFFKQRLIDLHDSTRQRIIEAKEQMQNRPEMSDDSDIATWEEQCAISLRILDREQKLLPKIQQSLERIRTKDYGYCLESGEPIGIGRLLARPTAEFCIGVKDISEFKERVYRD